MPTESAHSATVEVDAGTIRGRDGFDVDFTVLLSVHLHESTVDRAAFAEAFGLGKSVAGSTNRIADHIRDRVLAAVKAAPEQEASELVQNARVLAPEIAKAVRTTLFAVGLELAGEPVIAADSPALRAREAERAAVEASKAAAKHADDLLLRFEDIRRQNPDVSPAKLLMALPEKERYEAMRLLFEAAAKKDQSRLFLAAGTRLFEVAGDSVRDASDIGELGELGPARCLRRITDDFYDLAIGARDGVMLYSTQRNRTKPLRSRITGDSPLGFSDVSYHPACGEWVWASHSTYGVEGWPLGQQGGWPTSSHSSNSIGGARCVAAINCGHVAVDAEGAIRLVEVDPIDHHDEIITLSDTPRPAVALLNRRERRGEDQGDDPVAAILVLANGQLVDLLRSDVTDAVELHDGLSLERPLTAACAVPWLGDIRIAACVENGPVLVAGPDDDVWMEYHSDHSGFAAVAASAGHLAAVTHDRQRLVIWTLGKPDAPEHDLHVLDTTRSRVADVTFL